MTQKQRQQLESQLWKIANELRGKMDADEFRDYILGFIFYKFLSERQHQFANELLETEPVPDYCEVTEAAYLEALREESLLELGYFLHPQELFAEITAKGNARFEGQSDFILEELDGILQNIERSTVGTESEAEFHHLFEDLDLSSTKLGRTPQARNALIAQVLAHLQKLDFGVEEAEADVLGDAYEYLIGQFASSAGKKAGEFYTPQAVSKVLAKIVTLGKSRIKTVYDPTCGSGSLLLRVARETQVGEFFGQELNRTTYNLARMNLILHQVHFRQFNLKQEDVLERPQHLGRRFEAVVANPPFSAKWRGKNHPLFATDDRFAQYGVLAPVNKADFAFVQHMIHHLADHGTMAVVLPHGVLFRGGAEAKIRSYLIGELNYLDAVIGLPPNLFYGTSIPACILVFQKCRVDEEHLLFIDASRHFEKAGSQNFLTEAQVEAIIGAYRERATRDKFACVASLDEVKANDYNLNIPRYVDTFEEEAAVDLNEVTQALNAIALEMQSVDASIARDCEELGLVSPLSSVSLTAEKSS